MFEIEKLRRARGLTLQAFAEKIGCSLNYIWRVENGRANPTQKFLQRMADGLEVSLAELLTAPAPVVEPEEAVETAILDIYNFKSTSKIERRIIPRGNVANVTLACEPDN